MSTKTTTATATALTATVGLAAISWMLTIRLMNGMDMGVRTQLGSFKPFIIMWVVMMAAMMLPGIVPAVLRHAHVTNSMLAVMLFVGSYLAVWLLFGIGVFALYRPHGPFAAGVMVIAAGIYELTPLKKVFRHRCCGNIRSGFDCGLYCMGSSIGLMVMQVALGVMSITWMVLIAIVVCAQKLFPARAAIDIPLALMIVALGILIIIAPSTISGLASSM